MTEKEQEYIELYPIYTALCKDIETNILQKNKKVSVFSGNNTFVNSTFGRIVYIENITKVLISYHLTSFKYKEEIKEKLKELYKEYYKVEIKEENIEKGFLKECCDLVVKIDCMANKNRYMKLNILEKQQLVKLAIHNVQNGIAIISNPDEENKSKK